MKPRQSNKSNLAGKERIMGRESMGNSKLVHPPMNGFPRLMKRALQVSLVVGFAMMMGDGSVWMMRRPVPDERKTAFDHRQHVLRGPRIEEPPFVAHRHINGRGMGEDAALPAIVMQHGHIVGSPASGRKPCVFSDLQSGFESKQPASLCPDLDLERARSTSKMQRPPLCGNGAPWDLNRFIGHTNDGNGDHVLRGHERLKLGARRDVGQSGGERFICAKNEVGQNDRVECNDMVSSLALAILRDVANRGRTVDRRVDRPVIRAFRQIDRELEGSPRSVVPRLPVLNIEVERRAETSRAAQRPPRRRVDQRDFLGAGVGTSYKDTKRMSGDGLGGGVGGRQTEQKQQISSNGRMSGKGSHLASG